MKRGLWHPQEGREERLEPRHCRRSSSSSSSSSSAWTSWTGFAAARAGTTTRERVHSASGRSAVARPESESRGGEKRRRAGEPPRSESPAPGV
eukprot:2307144-Rhodomonas_salina.1